MPHLGMRRFSLALAAVTLAAAGGLAGGSQAQATSNLSLLILPDQGENAIYSFVNSATSSIDVTIYELKDTTLENDLVSREKAGVNVRVILDQAQKSYNTGAYNVLTAGGVGVTYSSTAFTYTHQKTITVNNAESYISTGNFDNTYYATSRDYGVFDTNAVRRGGDRGGLQRRLREDLDHPVGRDGPGLVAHRLADPAAGPDQRGPDTLDIEQEEFSDSTLVNAVVADAKRGVTVRVVLEDPSSYSSEVNEVTAAGGKVTGYSSTTGFYIHAKTVIADYGTLDRQGVRGLGELLEQLAQQQPGTRADHHRLRRAERPGDDVHGGLHRVKHRQGGHLQPGHPDDRRRRHRSTSRSRAKTPRPARLSYSATGLPTGLSISSSTGVISGTASKAGTYSVTVTGKDSTGPTGSATFTWTVGSAANTVTVTNPGSQTGTVGTAASLQISATDSASGQTLSYGATGLPAGLSISASTGLISGTPTTAGTYSVTVTATDTTGASGNATFSWTIGSGSGGGCTAAQLLGNPGFETGTAAPWTASSGVISDHSQEPPHTGSGTPGWTATAPRAPTRCPRRSPCPAAAARTS